MLFASLSVVLSTRGESRPGGGGGQLPTSHAVLALQRVREPRGPRRTEGTDIGPEERAGWREREPEVRRGAGSREW